MARIHVACSGGGRGEGGSCSLFDLTDRNVP